MRNISFLDLKTQYELLKSDIDDSIRQVLQHGSYILGPEVAALESALAGYVGRKHAIGCASGTDALLVALMAHGVGPGDAVLTTPFTFFATAEVIALLGATPVFVDIDRATFNLDPAALARAVAAVLADDPAIHPLPRVANARRLKPKAAVAVDLFGLPCDYEAVSQVCGKAGLFLLEDAAQSFGAEYHSRRACSFGDMAATSFFPAKPLGCYGDGGMIFTDDDEDAGVCRSLIVHGKGIDKYNNVRIGLNARLDTLQAAILLAKFRRFPQECDARDNAARTYTTELVRRLQGRVAPPAVPSGYRSAWAQYTVRLNTPTNEVVRAALEKLGVPAAIYYPKALHLQPAFSYLGYRQGDFPESESASREVLSLPFGPYMSADDQAQVLEALTTAAADASDRPERP